MNAQVGLCEPSAESWDSYLAEQPGDVFAQTTMWARTKSPGSSHFVIGLRRGADLVGGSMLLVRRIGPVRVVYAPRGPILSAGYEAHATLIVERILSELSSLQPTVLILQPASLHESLQHALTENRMSRSPVDVTTPATVEVDLSPEPEQLLAAMRSSRRTNIRRAERMGVVVHRTDHDGLEVFHDLHNKTAARQGFEPMTRDYLNRQWAILGDSGVLRVYVAEMEGQPLSAATMTAFGDRVVYKLAGLSDDEMARKAHASDYLHWKVILDARAEGFRYYDLGGFDRNAAAAIESGGEVPEELRSSPSQFKLGFGGRAGTLPQAQWLLLPGPMHTMQPMAAEMLIRFTPLRSAIERLRS